MLDEARNSRFRIGSISLHVELWGSAGPALLLLHGIGSRGVSWLPVVDQLAREFRLIAPDLRGHGGSDKPSSGYRMTDYADDLDGLIDALALEHPLIAGNSLGGLVAWEWASRHPSRAAAIVLEDAPLTPSAGDDARFDDWIALASSTPAEAAARFRLEHPEWSDEECERRATSITSTHPGVFAESRTANKASNNRLAQIAAIELPMLLVHGDPATGGMVSDQDAAAFAQAAPNGRAVKIAGGSHALHRDSTAAFLAAALPFLREHAS